MVCCDVYYTTVSLGDDGELLGPDDLTDVLIKGREHSGAGMRSHLGDSQLRTVIRTAFYASLRPEEGRYPRFRLFARHDAGGPDSLRGTVIFSKPIPLGVESLRMMASAFPPGENALVLVQEGEDIQIRGAINLEIPSRGQPAGRPEFWNLCARNPARSPKTKRGLHF